jgi:hypothetical protein
LAGLAAVLLAAAGCRFTDPVRDETDIIDHMLDSAQRTATAPSAHS